MTAFRPELVSPLTGLAYSYLPDQDCEFDLDDLARGLAGTNRYNGLTEPYVNVAQHSLDVSKILEEKDYGPELQLDGLLHDAEEIVTGDVPHPMKEIRLCDLNLGQFIEIGDLDREELKGKAEDTGFDVGKYTDDELEELYTAFIGANQNVKLGDVLDPIDENIQSSLYSEFDLERPSKQDKRVIKEADIEATAYETLYLMSDEGRETFLDKLEADYEERLRAYMDEGSEKPDYLDFQESADESRHRFVNRFNDLMDRV